MIACLVVFEFALLHWIWTQWVYFFLFFPSRLRFVEHTHTRTYFQFFFLRCRWCCSFSFVFACRCFELNNRSIHWLFVCKKKSFVNDNRSEFKNKNKWKKHRINDLSLNELFEQQQKQQQWWTKPKPNEWMQKKQQQQQKVDRIKVGFIALHFFIRYFFEDKKKTSNFRFCNM